MMKHVNDSWLGVVYLINFKGRLVDPKFAPEYWNSYGRFFIKNKELLDVQEGTASVISIFDEKINSISRLALTIDRDYPLGINEIALRVDIPTYGKFNWIASPVKNSKNRMIEIYPASKAQLEVLYKSGSLFFIGTNYSNA